MTHASSVQSMRFKMAVERQLFAYSFMFRIKRKLNMNDCILTSFFIPVIHVRMPNIFEYFLFIRDASVVLLDFSLNS